jgi:uncharacterized phage protein (TIGR01671 family)
MRPIKFRLVKDKKIVSTQELKPNGIIDCPVEWDTAYQFTGLLDKQGKEIYEGDIVIMTMRENIGTFNVPDDIIANNGYTGREDIYKGRVKYQDGYFGIDDKESGCVNFMFGDEVLLEVIGNIYKNPELLGGPK